MFAGSTAPDDIDRLLFGNLGEWFALTWHDGPVRPPKNVPYGTHLATYVFCEAGKDIRGLNLCWLVESTSGEFFQACPPLVGIDATWLFRYETLRRFTLRRLSRIQIDALQLPPLAPTTLVSEDLHSFRQRRDLDSFRHPGYPDDISTAYGRDFTHGDVTFHSEQVWVRVQGVVDQSTFRGFLLNQPIFATGNKDDRVLVRVLPGAPDVILVSVPDLAPPVPEPDASARGAG